MSTLTVVAAGPFTTVQDLGRTGYAHLGVGRAGAADRGALRLANRIVANPPGAAALEVTFGGLDVLVAGDMEIAVAGAVGPVTLAGRPGAAYAVLRARDGNRVQLGPPTAGTRSYLAVRGGIDVPPVLGSRSTDTLAALGPHPLRSGDVLPIGPPPAAVPLLDVVPAAPPTSGEVSLRVVLGPRADWFTPAAVRTLLTSSYAVTTAADRVGLRLAGPPLDRQRHDELPSEGLVRGALQVPPDGRPTLLLADHPVTGGYPVVAVVVDADADRAGQLRPGQQLRFRAFRDDGRPTPVTGRPPSLSS